VRSGCGHKVPTIEMLSPLQRLPSQRSPSRKAENGVKNEDYLPVAYMKSAIPDCLFLSFSKIDSSDRSSTSNRCFV